jgi:hypothetical protein
MSGFFLRSSSPNEASETYLDWEELETLCFFTFLCFKALARKWVVSTSINVCAEELKGRIVRFRQIPDPFCE